MLQPLPLAGGVPLRTAADLRRLRPVHLRRGAAGDHEGVGADPAGSGRTGQLCAVRHDVRRTGVRHPGRPHRPQEGHRHLFRAVQQRHRAQRLRQHSYRVRHFPLPRRARLRRADAQRGGADERVRAQAATQHAGGRHVQRLFAGRHAVGRPRDLHAASLRLGSDVLRRRRAAAALAGDSLVPARVGRLPGAPGPR